MTTDKAKQIAAEAGLELYWEPQWRVWGLVDPQLRVESLWLSSNQLKGLHADEFTQHYINEMKSRLFVDANRFQAREPLGR